MKKINENFENLDPVQKREVEEESGLYIERDPRMNDMNATMRSANDKVKDRGPSAERNLQNLKK